MADEIYTYVGKKIRAYREQKKMSQETLAQELDVTANTISRWETATYRPSVADLERVSRVFGVPIWTFLPSEAAPPTEKQHALLSATGDLPVEDLEELERYADFIRARQNLRRRPTRPDRRSRS